MAVDKKIENAQRLRYVRLLVRFLNSVVAYLSKSESLNKEQFVKRIENNSKYLDRIEPVALYKSELTDLEALVKKIKSLALSEKSIEDISDEILHSANKLEQSNNSRRYKRDKHKNDQYKDWQ
jgi:Leucine-rich repeat (LRR) protein